MQNLALPVVVENTASIFFDSNAPVVTNTVWNTLVSDLFVGTPEINEGEEKIIVVPNPFHLQAELFFSKSFTNTESQFTMIDAFGRIVMKRNVKASSIIITNENMPSGIYFFELKNAIGKRSTGKFIVE